MRYVGALQSAGFVLGKMRRQWGGFGCAKSVFVASLHRYIYPALLSFPLAHSYQRIYFEKPGASERASGHKLMVAQAQAEHGI